MNGEKTFSENIQGMASGISDALIYKKEELLNEIKFFINSNVNKMSRIDIIKQARADKE